MSCGQMVRMNDNYLVSVIKVRLCKHSTNKISPTDENRQMVWRIRHSWGVLVRARFHFVLVDYADEYGMKSMINRYLVNCNIASFGCSNM